MQAALFYGPYDVRLEEIDCPVPGIGEVLVKIGAATTSGTDLKTYRRGHPVIITRLPSLLGHEIAGTVAAVGPGVSEFSDGVAVVAANSAPCMFCFYCKRGQHNLCENLQFLNGAYAEYILVPAPIVRHNLLCIPDGVDFTEAAMTESLACAVHGIEASGIRLGDTVAIIGAGSLGLLLTALAKLKGARVILCGRGEERLELSRSFGADHIVDMATLSPAEVVVMVKDLSGGRGADVSIEAVGVPEIWERSIEMTRRGGQVTLFGGCPADTAISVPTFPLHYGELTLKGVFHHTPAYFATALELIATRQVDVGALLSGILPLERLLDAFALLENKRGIKYAIVPSTPVL